MSGDHWFENWQIVKLYICLWKNLPNEAWNGFFGASFPCTCMCIHGGLPTVSFHGDGKWHAEQTSCSLTNLCYSTYCMWIPLSTYKISVGCFWMVLVSTEFGNRTILDMLCMKPCVGTMDIPCRIVLTSRESSIIFNHEYSTSICFGQYKLVIPWSVHADRCQDI